ncbi:MAG TPA: alpha/beta fold hydrolase [Candidatus Limnocylindria bacterium]|nr:alpha/beta fold hydrolase [Candidatus Limnocylindria bacterium]
MIRSKTVSVMGLRTRVLEEGDAGRGDAVLMIHGVGGWAENWREVMTPIARSGRHAIAFDLPGFGQSDPPGDVEHFGPRDPFYPRFIGALLDELGIRSAHLVGNSMGGAVAYTAAVSQPERTRSLALVAGGGVGTEVALFLRLCTLPGVAALSRVFGRPEQARDVLRTCFHDSRRIPELLYDEAERYGFASFGEFVRALRSGVTIFGVRQSVREHWVALAPRFAGPVIVIWGRQDRVLPVAHAAEAEDVMPQARVELIDDCGHLPQVERTEVFLAALLPFLDRAEAAAAA